MCLSFRRFLNRDNKASHNAAFLGIGVGEIIDDVVRYAKHMVSPRGLIFLGKQFLMQSMNARRETGIFNPIGFVIPCRITISQSIQYSDNI